MNTPDKITVRWHHATPSFDADIVQRYAPALYRAVQGGALNPIVDDVVVIDLLVRHQFNRDEQAKPLEARWSTITAKQVEEVVRRLAEVEAEAEES